MNEAEYAVSTTVSEETVQKLMANMNMLSRMAHVGQVRVMQPNITGVPVLLTTQFQFADGSEITNVDSPLASAGITTRNTPDIRGKYLIGASNSSTNADVGSDTCNLQHNHTGLTGIDTYPYLFVKDGSVINTLPLGHTHTVANDLNAAEPVNPAYMYFAIYLKIM